MGATSLVGDHNDGCPRATITRSHLRADTCAHDPRSAITSERAYSNFSTAPRSNASLDGDYTHSHTIGHTYTISSSHAYSDTKARTRPTRACSILRCHGRPELGEQ